MPANLRDAVSTGEEANYERTFKGGELWRERYAGNDRNIRRLDAPLGEIDRGGCLGGAADAEDDNLGLVEVLGALAIIVAHGEVESVDPLEVVRVKGMLSCHLRCGGRVEVFRKDRNYRIENRHAGNAKQSALMLEMGSQALIYDGEEHDTWLLLDLPQGTIELAGCADERVDMSDWAKIGVLGSGGLGNRIQGLARGIRDQMEVVVALCRRCWHLLLKNCGRRRAKLPGRRSPEVYGPVFHSPQPAATTVRQLLASLERSTRY